MARHLWRPYLTRLSQAVIPTSELREQGGGQTAGVSAPGPALVLTRGEPIAIRVTNRLSEPTSVHWHGIELQSYYDGVAGWTGYQKQVTPMIQPGKSFTVYFNPPRAGTFIYHTPMNDLSQLSSGLYGAIVVLPPGKVFSRKPTRYS
jgi:FtsP/CotA-like multicopper oxidase with cupredoxin domain